MSTSHENIITFCNISYHYFFSTTLLV